MGVDDSTPSPDRGVISKDENGRVTGVFHEASAMNYVRRTFPKRNSRKRL
eukprot:CAMPEP_0114597476 /NCGR_PEP_ID=MMETSP0125-20121206/19760_1 /TAXON_ID=485358 ORGANISM="Aristerostoma sp., Strain ATCC 50986" /NCGR_SAMPLE_ID=MMETSP0125 /ASSEMBLY_ACC=CAM_ASM_000245 /LENGTH=49 /DNA_ID=CAMNT_0001802073 /DNA_START=214 /DNA_END=363 /DNA_ORIENTATION=-